MPAHPPTSLPLHALAHILAHITTDRPDPDDSDVDPEDASLTAHLGVTGSESPTASHPGIGPTLVRARRADEVVELAMLTDIGDPAVALRGTDLPEPWDAVGVMAMATARLLPDGATPAPPPHPVGFALLVDRAGASAHAIRAVDVESAVGLPDEPRPGGQGRLVDACRRTLGLPTTRPDVPVGSLWSALWLDAVLAFVLDCPGGPHPWTSVAALHPAVTLLAIPARDLAVEGVLDEAAAHLARDLTWLDARHAVTRQTITVPGLAAGHAAWFDDGSFSRAALEGLPDVPGALSILDAVVAPPLLARVAAVVLHTARLGRDAAA